MEIYTLSLAALLLMISVHLFSTRYALFTSRFHSAWLSFAGGVSVAYIFVRILPVLGKDEATIAALFPDQLPYLDYHVYLVSLFGLIFFYGLDRAAILSRRRNLVKTDSDEADRLVFYIHVGAYAAINLLIGYLLLHRDDVLPLDLAIFACAMILYFFVVDHNLHEHHSRTYDRVGRWILAAAVSIGWLSGLVAELSDAQVAVFFAFLAGGAILNVLNQESPSRQEGRFWAFVLGAVSYAALLVAI